MNLIGIDKLNIGLIICSFLIALFFPFELFLFSYAFLGPIHYLTEINWLHQKKYFTNTNSKWMFVFVVFVTLLTLLLILKNLGFIDIGFNKTSVINAKVLLLTAFFFAISLLFFKQKTQLFLILAICFLLAILCKKIIPVSFYFVGVFLPTIIHVYFFTLAFILYGSLKAKSKFGFLAIFLLLVIPVIIAFLPLNEINYFTSNKTIETYIETNFKSINQSIAFLFRVSDFKLTSLIGIKIQIFIAFSYTYHYLNWFSKTNSIGWKKDLTNQKIIYIVLIWISSVSLYLYDYKTGLIALFFLSMLHVLLEFPLNIFSIKESYFLIKKKGHKL
jgi:hypothetical protein